jgi:hypothetical protein
MKHFSKLFNVLNKPQKRIHSSAGSLRYVSLLILVAFLTCGNLAAQSCYEELSANPRLAGNNLLAYPDKKLPTLTPAPTGYQPFHIEHYGRHGSRWLLSDKDYIIPVAMLQKAADNKVITPEGASLLTRLKAIATDAQGNYGRLTTLGAEQHRGIARRMFRNFPEIFAGEARVDARSTTVVRCILSMSNELVELASLNPSLQITMESGAPLQPILNPNEFDTIAINIKRSIRPELKRYEAERVDPLPFASRLISSSTFINDSINARDLFNKVFELALNEQSHQRNDSLIAYFTPAELQTKWAVNNAAWFAKSGYSPMTSLRMPIMERNLINDFIDHAQQAVDSRENGATLRFGHETVLIPLTCIMGLNNADREIADLDSVAQYWQAYRIFPMGGNIQMIFYQNPQNAAAPVIVRILLNEHEATLPISPIAGTEYFYNWNEVKAMLLNRIK